MQRILFAAGAVLMMGPGAWAQLGSVKDSQMCKQDPNNVLCRPGEPDQFKMYKWNGTELVKTPRSGFSAADRPAGCSNGASCCRSNSGEAARSV